MRRLAIFLAILLLPCLSVRAQVSDSPKPALPAVPTDSLLRFERTQKYRLFERNYGSMYEFKPYDPLRIQPPAELKMPLFYARLGMQFPIMPSVGLGLQKQFRNGVYLGLESSHDSFFGSVPCAEGDGTNSLRRSANSIGGNFKYAWSAGEVYTSLKYSYDASHYTVGANPSHSLGAFSLRAGICSTKEKENNLYYKFDVGYRSGVAGYSANADPQPLQLRENRFNIAGYVGTTFDIHRVYVDINLDLAGYKNLKDYSTMIVEFSPFYELKRGRFDGRFGVRFGNRFGLVENVGEEIMPDGNDITATTGIFPDVDARVEIVRNYLWAHVKLGGGFDMNSYSDLAAACPLLMPDTPLKLGSRPFDAQLTFETVVFSRFAVNLTGSFVVQKDKGLFAPVSPAAGLPCPVVAYFNDVNTLSACLEAFWRSSALTVGGEIGVHKYYSSVGTSCLPACTAKAYFRCNWRERLVFSADMNYRSAIGGDKYGHWSAPPACDLNLSLSYALSKNFSVYAKCGNILDSRNQYVPYYVEPGRNVGGGVTFVF